MIDILLVEDDPVLGRGLVVNLEHEGYKVHWVKSLKEARLLEQSSQLALILLDLGLPDGNGLSFLETLRTSGSRIPVVVLTAQTDEDSVVEGLQLGANDYVRKPFGDRELLARIKTALREPQTRSAQIRYGDLLILLDQRQVMYSDSEVELTPREFEILTFFVQNSESVVTREALLRSIDKDGDIFDRTIDSNISHLRAKLKRSGVSTIQINSVYGVGYRLEKK